MPTFSFDFGSLKERLERRREFLRESRLGGWIDDQLGRRKKSALAQHAILTVSIAAISLGVVSLAWFFVTGAGGRVSVPAHVHDKDNLRTLDRPVPIKLSLAQLHSKVNPRFLPNASANESPHGINGFSAYQALFERGAASVFLDGYVAAAKDYRLAVEYLHTAYKQHGTSMPGLSDTSKLVRDLMTVRYVLWKDGDWETIGREAEVSMAFAKPGSYEMFDARLFYGDYLSLYDPLACFEHFPALASSYDRGDYPTVPIAKREEIDLSLGLTLHAYGRSAEALPYLTRAMTHHSVPVDLKQQAHRALVASLAAEGRHQEAWSHLQRLNEQYALADDELKGLLRQMVEFGFTKASVQ